MIDRARATWIGWGVVQAGLVLYAVVTGKWPWAMFGDPPSHDRVLVVEARAGDGPWETVPLDEVFRFRHGASPSSILHDAPALYGRGGRRERGEFARWIASELAPEATEVRISAEVTSIRTGRSRVDDLGTFPVP